LGGAHFCREKIGRLERGREKKSKWIWPGGGFLAAVRRNNNGVGGTDGRRRMTRGRFFKNGGGEIHVRQRDNFWCGWRSLFSNSQESDPKWNQAKGKGGLYPTPYKSSKFLLFSDRPLGGKGLRGASSGSPRIEGNPECDGVYIQSPWDSKGKGTGGWGN